MFVSKFDLFFLLSKERSSVYNKYIISSVIHQFSSLKCECLRVNYIRRNNRHHSLQTIRLIAFMQLFCNRDMLDKVNVLLFERVIYAYNALTLQAFYEECTSFG